MRHQQVVVDYWTMLKTSFTYLVLVVSFCVLLRMTYAVYMLPRVLRRSQDKLTERLMLLQLKLKEKADAEEAAEINSSAITEKGDNDNDNPEVCSAAGPSIKQDTTMTNGSPVAVEDEPKKDL